jgi:hypothetical protein
VNASRIPKERITPYLAAPTVSFSEWTLTASQTEPFHGGRERKIPIRVQGVSVMQVKNGKISQWSEYYDQLKSRRYGVATWITDWIEL